MRVTFWIRIEVRPVGHRHDIASLRIHHDDRPFLRLELMKRGVEFGFDDGLKRHVDRQTHGAPVTRRFDVASVRNEFVISPVPLDETIAVLSLKLRVHGSLDAFNAATFLVHESKNVTEH